MSVGFQSRSHITSSENNICVFSYLASCSFKDQTELFLGNLPG